jgi:hypothetical protein
VPRDLEAICLKALNKRPEDRYGSARAMAEDLQRCLNGRPILGRRPGASERLARWRRRRPAWFAVLLLALAVTTVVSVQQVELQKARHRLDAEGRRALRRVINRSQEVDLWRAIEAVEARIRGDSETRGGQRALASSYHRLGDLLVNTDRLADST